MRAQLVNLHPVSEVRSKDVPLVKGVKEWSTTMRARNLKPNGITGQSQLE